MLSRWQLTVVMLFWCTCTLGEGLGVSRLVVPPLSMLVFRWQGYFDVLWLKGVFDRYLAISWQVVIRFWSYLSYLTGNLWQVTVLEVFFFFFFWRGRLRFAENEFPFTYLLSINNGQCRFCDYSAGTMSTNQDIIRIQNQYLLSIRITLVDTPFITNITF